MSEKVSLMPKTGGFLLGQSGANLVVLGKPTRRGIRKCPKCGLYNGTRRISCKGCGLLLNTPKEKLPDSPQAVKLVCPSNVHIYSVNTDPSETNRCLVHLPVIEGIESLQDEAEVSAIKRSTAMCYASMCRQTVVQLSSIYLNFNPCDHTSSILNCQMDAVPLEIKQGIVEALPIPDFIKQDIIQLISASEDPVVQRVLKDTMVVKCEDLYHPLGYLHFRITKPYKKSLKYKVLCECHVGLKPSVPLEKRFCLHFYLCVCAIASDNSLWSEFNSFMSQVLNFEEVHITGDLEQNLKSDAKGVSSKKAKIDNNDTKSHSVYSPTLHFDDWLSSVTEQINQTMHYQFDGHPPPLTFRVPQAFFDILQNRITTGPKKKRLPNSVVAISRKTSPPIGVFSKYTYEITNILHVKRIFDSKKVPLEITRSFIDNNDGTFSPCKPEPVEGDILGSNQKVQNAVIKPAELKTFLKIGIMNVNQKEPTPFIIEWIPNILPQTHVGEMTIKFQYGHQKNGIIEKRNETPATSERKTVK